jgi:hypothetical protein
VAAVVAFGLAVGSSSDPVVSRGRSVCSESCGCGGARYVTAAALASDPEVGKGRLVCSGSCGCGDACEVAAGMAVGP